MLLCQLREYLDAIAICRGELLQEGVLRQLAAFCQLKFVVFH